MQTCRISDGLWKRGSSRAKRRGERAWRQETWYWVVVTRSGLRSHARVQSMRGMAESGKDDRPTQHQASIIASTTSHHHPRGAPSDDPFEHVHRSCRIKASKSFKHTLALSQNFHATALAPEHRSLTLKIWCNIFYARRIVEASLIVMFTSNFTSLEYPGCRL